MDCRDLPVADYFFWAVGYVGTPFAELLGSVSCFVKERAVTHLVDVHVGQRIRHRRWLVGMTQQQLAEKVGIKFQQIQKYETGANRVSASRLWDIAATLDVPVAYFYEGLAANDGAEAPPAGHALDGDLLHDKEALDLVRTYYAIPPEQRRRLFDLARVLSNAA